LLNPVATKPVWKLRLQMPMAVRQTNVGDRCEEFNLEVDPAQAPKLKT